MPFPLSTPLGFPKSPDNREGINGSKKRQDRGPALRKDQTSACLIISRAVEILVNCKTSTETPGKETVARKTDFCSSFRGGIQDRFGCSHPALVRGAPLAQALAPTV